MKKNLIKKVFAVSLSIAMACSFLPAANPVTASAAAPYVSLKTTFKTLKVNQSYTMTLKNNTINWKIKKVETTDKTIATVYGKTTKQVMIKGKSEGRATIRVRLATSKRKTKNTKTLRCRVKVIPAASTPDPTTPVQTDAIVTSQAELDTALADTNITKITIRPTTAENFVIPNRTYPNVDLIVDAPLSDIENSAVFNSITINDIKPETWTEKAVGNTFSILAKAARLVVDKAASVKSITIGTADSKVDLVVNEGTVQSVNVTAKTTLNITGTAADTSLIPVTFGVGAADSTFVTEIPAAVSLSANVELTFEKGAVKSTVKLEVTGIKATITNNTPETIVVTKNDGKTTQNIIAGAQKATANSVSTTTPVNPGSSSGSGNGSTIVKPVTSYRINTEAGVSVTISGSAYGVADVISEGSIQVRISGITTTPSALNVPVGYSITAVQDGKSYRRTIGSGTLTSHNVGTSTSPSYVYFTDEDAFFDISGLWLNENTKFVVSFYVKESDKEAGSVAVQATTNEALFASCDFSDTPADVSFTINGF